MSTYLTLRQAAALLGVSVKTIRRRISAGELTAHRVGKGARAPIRISERQVHALLKVL